MNAQVPITDLNSLFEELDAGVFGQKVATALSDVALGVVSTGKPGEVTITFAMKQIGDSRQLEMSHKLKYSRPTAKGKLSEENTTKTPLYVGSRGALTLIPDTQQGLFVDKSKD